MPPSRRNERFSRPGGRVVLFVPPGTAVYIPDVAVSMATRRHWLRYHPYAREYINRHALMRVVEDGDLGNIDWDDFVVFEMNPTTGRTS